MKNQDLLFIKDCSGSIDIEDFKRSMENFSKSLEVGNHSKDELEVLSKRSNVLIDKIDMAINKKSQEQSFKY